MDLTIPFMSDGKNRKVGSRAQVWHGTAEKTSGGLTKSDLMYKNGRIISKRRSQIAKANVKHTLKGWILNKNDVMLPDGSKWYPGCGKPHPKAASAKKRSNKSQK